MSDYKVIIDKKGEANVSIFIKKTSFTSLAYGYYKKIKLNDVEYLEDLVSTLKENGVNEIK
jgi:hypothetical protein